MSNSSRALCSSSLAVGDIMEQRRPREEQRSLLREEAGRDRLGRARRIAEADHQSARAQAVERFQEGVPADRIVDDRQLVAAGDPFDLGDEILARIDDRVGAAMGARELGFFVGADGADHRRAERLGPLADDQPDAARRGMDQDRLARLRPDTPSGAASAPSCPAASSPRPARSRSRRAASPAGRRRSAGLRHNRRSARHRRRDRPL